jgi:hypothetical protein
MWQQPNIPVDVINEKLEAVNKIADETAKKAAIQTMIDKNELARNRLFLGKRRDNSTMLVMSDIKGKPRIQLFVGADGEPKLEFLDVSGKVIQTLPDATKTIKR